MTYLLYIFECVIRFTIYGSIVALLIIILRSLFKNILGARLTYCIWFFLIIKLIVPYTPKNQAIVLRLPHLTRNKIVRTYQESDYIYRQTINSVSDDVIANSEANPILKKSNMKTNINYTTPDHIVNMELYFKIASTIWLTVVVCLSLYIIFATSIFSIKLKKLNRCKDNNIISILDLCKEQLKIKKDIMIINTSLVRMPAIFGIIHPKLLLPLNINKWINSDELKCVFLHELAHLRRKDLFIGYITVVLQVLHWFNPIIWYSFYKMNQDKELACDALALANLKPDKAQLYGYTIIKLLEIYKKPNSIYGMAYMLNNRSQIKRRIIMISLFKKNSYKFTIISIVVLLGIGGIVFNIPQNNIALGANKDTTIETTKKSDLNISEIDVADKNYKGKMLVVKDPSSVKLGFDSKKVNSDKTTSEIAKENGAICAINAGLVEYVDSKGDAFINHVKGKDGKEYLSFYGKLAKPNGIVIHNGQVESNSINDENKKDNIVGFTNKGKLIVGSYSIDELKNMDMNDAVSSMNSLIINGKPLISANMNSPRNPRTAIGQKKDGTVLMLTIDGRNPESIGATLYDLQKVFLESGAYNASCLDGGSSSTMYYNGKVINNPSDINGECAVSSIFMVIN